MKVWLLGLMLVGLSSCSHAYVRSWDASSVTACCPSGKVFCTREKLDELAESQCGGGRDARAIAGSSVDSGASATYGSGFARVRATSDMCVTYSCN
jgi:hypothetical protein